jgi:ParB family chromosome partitioning protein
MSKKPSLTKRSSLGKGLSAILSDSSSDSKEPVPEEVVKEVIANIAEIPLDRIELNPYQPRQEFDEEALNELSNSIRVQGLIQPITVRKLDAGNFQLISGERRLRASKMAGLQQIPAYVRLANDQQMLEMAIIENVQREDLNAMEVALSYQRLISECELKQEELGERVGKKRSTVTNYLRLLKLPDAIQASLKEGVISMGHARCLINIDNAETQLAMHQRIVNEGLSVRKVEELVRQLFQGTDVVKKEKAPATTEQTQRELKRLQSTLSTRFGTRVQINAKNDDQGEIKIPYHSVDDLNRLLDILEK